MKWLSLLLLCQIAFGATAQVNSVNTFNGMAGSSGSGALTLPNGSFAPVTNSVTIGGGQGNIVQHGYYSFYQTSGATYQVPNLKTFQITDIWIYSTVTHGVIIGSSTANPISQGTTTQPTGAVGLLRADFSTSNASPFTATANIWVHHSFPNISFAQNTYPIFKDDAAAATQTYIIITGYVQ